MHIYRYIETNRDNWGKPSNHLQWTFWRMCLDSCQCTLQSVPSECFAHDMYSEVQRDKGMKSLGKEKEKIEKEPMFPISISSPVFSSKKRGKKIEDEMFSYSTMCKIAKNDIQILKLLLLPKWSLITRQTFIYRIIVLPMNSDSLAAFFSHQKEAASGFLAWVLSCSFLQKQTCPPANLPVNWTAICLLLLASYPS